MWGTDQTTGGSVSFHGGPSHLTLFNSHKLTQKKRANTHIRTLLGQVPQEIIIQLQNEDQKCHPLLLRSSSANPFLLGFCVFLHTSFLFFYTLSVLLHMQAVFLLSKLRIIHVSSL